ncbi:chaplin [Streptomyces griseoviridis]
MRQTLGKGMVAAAAASSILSLYGSPAFADTHAGAVATGSPGVLSGNSVAVPVDVPVNACGNTVDGAAALNPAFGNKCVNASSPRPHHHRVPGLPHGHGHGYGYGDESGYGYGDESGYGYGEDSGYGSSGYGEDTPPPRVPPQGGHHTPPGGGHHTPPGGGHHTPPGGGHHTPPGGGHHTPPPHGGHHTPPGGGHHTPPGGGHHTPPGGGHHTPPPGGGEHTPPPPSGGHHTPPPSSGRHTPPVAAPGPELAHTGSGGMLAAGGASAVLIGAGALLYRRGRTGVQR